jgi:hypothetical protein
MRSLYAVVFSVCLLLAMPNVVHAQTSQDVAEATKVLKDWDAALNLTDNNPAKVEAIVRLYAAPPVLMFLGTKNDHRVTDTAGLRAYFTNLVTNYAPKVRFCREAAVIPVSPSAVLFAGLYLFTLKSEPVLAHYSFLIVRTNEGWRIAHHLSTPWPGTVRAQCST